MNNKVALIIPYFGRKPDYFDLWLKSAEANPSFTFYIATDLDLGISDESNVKVLPTTFLQLKERIQELVDIKIVLHSPYKLCDYKPMYGLIFEKELEGYDFWGFCDVDLIFGKISKFVNDKVLDKYDKLFYEGHFSLFRNNEKMNNLYLKKEKNVLDYKYAFRTKYVCHFDESGIVPNAYKYDNSIKFYNDWCFYDVPYFNYTMISRFDNVEKCALYENGHLYQLKDGKKGKREIMYIHLQKRKMDFSKVSANENYYIYRNEFVPISEQDNYPFCIQVDEKKQNEFYDRYKKMRRKQIIDNIKNGALKNRIRLLLKK